MPTSYVDERLSSPEAVSCRLLCVGAERPASTRILPLDREASTQEVIEIAGGARARRAALAPGGMSPGRRRP
jgi:hypothetical protein